MMRSALFTAVLMIFAGYSAFAQQSGIKGRVRDITDSSTLSGATVELLAQSDSSIVKTVLTDKDGRFLIENTSPGNYILKLSMIGYEEYVSIITLTEAQKNLGTLRLNKRGKELSTVTIISKAPPVVQKGDTSQFSASQYKVNPDANTEDLIKKMPGITVDKDGTVTAQGEQIKKVTIDGKDFFGDDVSAALKNLPSEVVDKIQVFDKLSDQAQLTGVDDGNSLKAINIITKAGIKNGQFGRAYAGYGTDERYSAGGNVSFFKGNRRVSLVGNFNNINQQNFGSQDLLGITGSSGNNRGGGMPRGGGRGGGSESFTVGQSYGISKTNAAGINYSDQWGKKFIVSGSYFFNNSTNNNESNINTETFAAVKNQFSSQNSNSNTINNNHRINLRMEYRLDSSNSFFLIPSINFQDNHTRTLSSQQNYYGINDSLNTSLINTDAKRNGFNIRNNIMYRHSFPKKGRTLSLGFNTTISKNNGETISDGAYRFFDGPGLITDSLQNQFYDNRTNGHTLGGNIAYTEPISKKSQLQIDYTPSVQKNKANQETFLYDGVKYSILDTTLSNKFDNTVTTHNAGLTYRYTPNKDEQLSVGLNFQHADMESDRIYPTVTSVNQAFTNLLPNAMWRKKFSSYSNIRIFYRASTNFPSVSQLQDVVNLSNPLRVSSGNPSLKQSFVNYLGGRYIYTNSKTNRSFFANIFMQAAEDYISNATFIASADSVIQQGIILKKGSQLTKPVNLNGFRSFRTFLTYSTPIKVLKTTLNINAGFSYSKLPGMVNYIKTATDNYVYNGGVVFASNISQYVDFNLSYNASFNNARTKSTTVSTNNYVNQSAGLQLNLLSKNGWFMQHDVSNQTYSGLSEGLNQSFWLWNAAIGKKFLKSQAAELKLSVFDLLKQNQSIVRTVTESNLQDAQNQVLKQYFMLTFTYNLKNFGKGKAVAAKENMNEGRPYGHNPGF